VLELSTTPRRRIGGEEMEVSGQLHAPAALLLRKEPLVPIG